MNTIDWNITMLEPYFAMFGIYDRNPPVTSGFHKKNSNKASFHYLWNSVSIL